MPLKWFAGDFQGGYGKQLFIAPLFECVFERVGLAVGLPVF